MSKELSSWEKSNGMCEVCGYKSGERGLKIHKSHHNHWGMSPSASVINSVEVPDLKEIDVSSSNLQDSYDHGTTVATSDLLTGDESSVTFEYVSSESGSSEFTPITQDEIDSVEVPCFISPKISNVKSNLLGSRVSLKGLVYTVEGVKFTVDTIAEAMPGIIIRLWSDLNNQEWADIKLEASEKVVVVSILQIIPPGDSEPSVKILRLGHPKSSLIPDLTATRKLEFVESLRRYVRARDAKLEAEKAYKEVDGTEREVLVKYAEDFGVPSEEGKRDNVIIEDGYKVYWSYKDNPDKLERDDDSIINWCIQHGYLHALKVSYVVVDEVWSKMKDSGAVPADFLSGVEKEVSQAPTRRLYVERV